jgi:hypothetical protein
MAENINSFDNATPRCSASQWAQSAHQGVQSLYLRSFPLTKYGKIEILSNQSNQDNFHKSII